MSAISEWNHLIESEADMYGFTGKVAVAQTRMSQNIISRIGNNVLETGNVFRII